MGKFLEEIKAIAQEHGHNFAGIEDVEAWCREQRGKPAPAPLLTDNQLREQMPDKVRCAVEFFHDDRNSYGSVTAMWGHGQACTLHISDLTRRLAEAEAKRDEYRACAVKQDYGRKDFICSVWTQVDLYEKDRADLNATCAALAVGVKREAERAEAAEARLAEVESGVGVVQYRRLEAQLRDAEARVREMEAFKVRVMAWASERCICGLVGKACPKGMFDGETKWATSGPCPNWTPPQAWEVGE